MASFSSTQNDANETSIMYIQKINSEREKIVSIINNSQQVSVDGSTMSKFEKYITADRFVLENLQTPESIDEMIAVDEPDVMGALRLELEALQEDLSNAVQHNQEQQNEYARTKERLDDLQGITDNLEPLDSESLKKIMHNMKRTLKKDKERLKQLLDAVMLDSDARYDFAILVNSGVKDPEAYVTLKDDDDVRERIELLMKCRLFEQHPDNPLMMRMVNLL